MIETKRNNVYLYILVFFLGVVCTVGGIYYFRGELFGGVATSNGACYTACENKVTVKEDGLSYAVDKVYDAVVTIENFKGDTLYSTGTGFIYKVDNKSGYLITNYHVINSNTSLKVVMSDGEEVVASLAGGDQYLDLAVLKIDKKHVKKVIEFGSSENAKLGDTVFTVGTPVDSQYSNTVTRGILSGKDRLVSVAVANSAQEDYVMKVIQTDASINPGNSGGPLLNVNGEVIGVNSLKLVENEVEGMGFAISIEDVEEHLAALETGKEIERPYLGISMTNVSDTYNLYKSGITLDSKIKKGVVVVEVVAGSSVDKILQKGDVIVEFDGEKTDNLAYLRYELYKHSVGDKIKVTYIRDNKENTVTITLKANPDSKKS